jgi:FHS family Na+ dependent glucose MFS transporter 1
MVGWRVCTLMANRKTVQTVAYFIAFAALGMAMASLGPTLPGLAQQTRSSVGDISFLFTVRSFGFLVGSLFGGRFYDRLPGHGVMAATIVAVSAAMAAMPLVGELRLLIAVMLVLGTAEGALGVGGNALMVWVHGSRVAPFMNALHFSYGVGGFIAPLIIARTLSADNAVRTPYFVLASLILPTAILLLRIASPPSAAVETDDRTSRAKSNYPLVFLIALLLCLYIGAEVSFGGWIYSYVLKLNLGNETHAAFLTSLFWGSLTLGRLLGVPIGARFRPREILLADLIGCFVSVGIAIIWPQSVSAITTATVLAGLSMASIYPTALTFAERRMTITGQVTGFLIVGGSVGGMIVPLVIGRMFGSIGPRVMMFTILADLLLLLVVYLVLVSRHVVPQQAEA